MGNLTYLKSRLNIQDLLRDEKAPNSILLSGFSDDIDKYYGAYGTFGDQPILENIPKEIVELLEELRKRHNFPDARFISKTILDFPMESINSVAEAIRKMKASKPKPDMFKRVTFKCDDTTFTILGCEGLPNGLIADRTLFRAMIEKYKLKTTVGICLSMDLNDKTQFIHSLAYFNKEWKPDQKMDELLKIQPVSHYQSKYAPKRNERCMCGSGKKFKKCCYDKVLS